jgi:hypothetical protein
MSFQHFKIKLSYKYYYLLDPFYKIIPIKRNDKIFIIFSEARSGTTWLAELLKVGLDASILWEPLHPQRGLISSKYGRRPYWTENNRNDLIYRLKKIFSGIGINSWTSKMENNLIPFYSASKPLLIKFTRVNRLLPEMFNHFQFKHKPVLLVRHPAAVFLSQFKTFGHPVEGFYWSGNKKDEVFADPRYPKHKDFINGLEELIYKEFAVYCMNNHHIYNNEIDSDKYFVILYEELLLNPLDALKTVTENWKLNDERIRHKIDSQQVEFADANTKNSNIELQLSKWKNTLSDGDKIKFQSILDHFQINTYNMKNSLPVKSKIT